MQNVCSCGITQLPPAYESDPLILPANKNRQATF